MKINPRWKKVILLATPAVCVFALAFHFAATVIYLMPPNPLKVKLARPVGRYMEPQFEQQWELFAPSPVVDSRFILVSCRVPDAIGALHETAWSDITTPMRETEYRWHRFSPAERFERLHQAGFLLTFPARSPVIEHIREQHKSEDDALHGPVEAFDDAVKSQVGDGKRLLARLAAAECDRQVGPGRTRQVRARIAIVKPPAFSQRTLPSDAGKQIYVDLDWAPYEHVSAL